MLDNLEFNNWCRQQDLSQAGQAIIEEIRSSNPSRRVTGARKNVCGSYPSRKMGCTIQFESHHNELARIYELEHDPCVLEYYDQPPAIELVYQSKSGRKNRHQYTPDFFIIRTDSAFWEECKTELELNKLNELNPNRYCKNSDGKWHCPPGEEYAHGHGLDFHVWSDALINWNFQQNLIWLLDYFGYSSEIIDETEQSLIVNTVNNHLGITLTELLQNEEINPDVLYWLIATDKLYVELNKVKLSQPETVFVFINQDVALSYEHLNSIESTTQTSNQILLQIAVGTNIYWDGESWEIVNTGTTTTGLLRADGKLIELPNLAFTALIDTGKIMGDKTTQTSNIKAAAAEIIKHATCEDIIEANRRYNLIQPYLEDALKAYPSSTIRRWRTQYQKALLIYGQGYLGLLPKHNNKGNRTPKIDSQTQEFMLDFIKEHYETPKQRRKIRVYESFVLACQTHDPPFKPPSRITFCHAIKQRSGHHQTRKRLGNRAAISEEPFYWELKQTTPRHGSRPFEIVHIDHTQIDIELVSSLESLTNCYIATNNSIHQNLGRPWATFMVDAYSRRILSVYLTFDEPSYRDCMMVIRICVARFGRFPQNIVVDNGKEFHSHYFEQLLASYTCTLKYRPPAHARFGSIVERLFGTANTQFIHELQGNTQIKRLHRKVTKSVSPERLAIWTLEELYSAFCEWAYSVYDQRLHPALGTSPCDAFVTGLATGGSRLHRRVAYDELFQILTLPAPDQRKRKVQPGKGVKIHNIYYWADVFRDPEIEKSMLWVRYDPWNAGIAYALAQGQWVKCISSYYQYFQGRSEKEIRLASAELNQRQRNYGRKLTINDRELVEFLNSKFAQEGAILKQRLRDTEHDKVHKIIQNNLIPEPKLNFSEFAAEENNDCLGDDSTNEGKNCETISNLTAYITETLEYYGEF
ncbi:DDE-type integrase/transposase/recombinase [Nostocales cyanobacterium LEGE 12452]|nr:DDE-type integrase/transposase/recombinase [Nostocales cyanobacterium LEGE 12452]